MKPIIRHGCPERWKQRSTAAPVSVAADFHGNSMASGLNAHIVQTRRRSIASPRRPDSADSSNAPHGDKAGTAAMPPGICKSACVAWSGC